MFLIGELNRFMLPHCKIVSEITVHHLVKAKENRDYQVINILDKTYYNTETNSWDNLNQ